MLLKKVNERESLKSVLHEVGTVYAKVSLLFMIHHRDHRGSSS